MAFNVWSFLDFFPTFPYFLQGEPLKLTAINFHLRNLQAKYGIIKFMVKSHMYV